LTGLGQSFAIWRLFHYITIHILLDYLIYWIVTLHHWKLNFFAQKEDRAIPPRILINSPKGEPLVILVW